MRNDVRPAVTVLAAVHAFFAAERELDVSLIRVRIRTVPPVVVMPVTVTPLGIACRTADLMWLIAPAAAELAVDDAALDLWDAPEPDDPHAEAASATTSTIAVTAVFISPTSSSLLRISATR